MLLADSGQRSWLGEGRSENKKILKLGNSHKAENAVFVTAISIAAGVGTGSGKKKKVIFLSSWLLVPFITVSVHGDHAVLENTLKVF